MSRLIRWLAGRARRRGAAEAHRQDAMLRYGLAMVEATAPSRPEPLRRGWSPGDELVGRAVLAEINEHRRECHGGAGVREWDELDDRVRAMMVETGYRLARRGALGGGGG